jgi:hypothetical protein
MVHRTDLVGCREQAGSRDRGICRHGPNRARVEKVIFGKPLSIRTFGGKKCSRRLMTAVPSVHAIYVETLAR